jgi:ABC-2 type transport system permease protein
MGKDMSGARELLRAFLQTWRSILSDIGAFGLIFLGGIAYSFFYPLPYSSEAVRQVPVAVVDLDHSALSRQIARYADAHPSVQVVAVTADIRQALDLLWRNEIAGTLLIPPAFSDKVLTGRQADVEAAGNGLYMMLNKSAVNGLAQAVGTVSAGVELKRLGATTPSPDQAQAQRQPVAVQSVPLFNVREGYGSYIVPGVIVLIMQQSLLMAIALMFGTWFERDGLPFSASLASYFGMLNAYASAAVLNCLYFFGFVLWWQDYPRGGNLAGMLVFVVLYSYTVAAFGMLLGTLFRTRERSTQLLLVTSLPFVFVSGLPWPAEGLPPLLQWFRWLIPSTAGIQGFIGLNQLGASLSEVAAEAAVLASLLVVSVIAGTRKWKTVRRHAEVATGT